MAQARCASSCIPCLSNRCAEHCFLVCCDTESEAILCFDNAASYSRVLVPQKAGMQALAANSTNLKNEGLKVGRRVPARATPCPITTGAMEPSVQCTPRAEAAPE